MLNYCREEEDNEEEEDVESEESGEPDLLVPGVLKVLLMDLLRGIAKSGFSEGSGYMKTIVQRHRFVSQTYNTEIH